MRAPFPLTASLLANEVIDALPAQRIRWRAGQWRTLGVTEGQHGLDWVELPLDDAAARAVRVIDTTALMDGYTTEIRPTLPEWLAQVTRSLRRGVVLFFDYGYPRREFYHPQREDGTAVAHRGHRSAADLLNAPGEQDLSVFVDFTAVAEAADACELDVLGFCGQGSFLLACDILSDMRSDASHRRDAAAELRRLTLPGEMGERFKVMALGRGVDFPLRGFSLTNQTHLL